MAQFSMMPWETKTGTGDGAASYTQDQASEFFRDFHVANTATQGVLYGIDNMLEVSGIASPLSVATGKAYCYSRYWNDAAVSLAVSTPPADTAAWVVLRTIWSQNVTRISLLSADAGVTVLPALTQTVNDVWEIPLASFVIDSSGDIWTDASKTVAGVTDTRHYVISPTTGMVKLRHIAPTSGTTVRIANIQTDLSGLELHVSGIVSLEATAGAAGPWFYDMTFNNDIGAVYNWVAEYYTGGVYTQVTANGDNRFQNVFLAPFLAGLAATTRLTTRTIVKIPLINPGTASYTNILFDAHSVHANSTGLQMQSRTSGGYTAALGTYLTSIEIRENVTFELTPSVEVALYGYK